jgi:hypothetical protein
MDLIGEHGEGRLKPLDARPPPKMAWCLIGIPLERFGEINTQIEQLSGVDGIVVETCTSDQENVDQDR